MFLHCSTQVLESKSGFHSLSILPRQDLRPLLRASIETGIERETGRGTGNIVIEIGTGTAIITETQDTATIKRTTKTATKATTPLLQVEAGPRLVTTPTLVVGEGLVDGTSMTGTGNVTGTMTAGIETGTVTTVAEGGARIVIVTTLPLVMSTTPRVITLRVGGAMPTMEITERRGEDMVATVVGVVWGVATEGGTGDTHSQEV